MLMYYAFQDAMHRYIIMDLLPGGDLFSIIENENSLDEAGVKFYMVEVTQG